MAAKRGRRKMTAAKRKRMAGGDHIPPEISREVLARLPAKSILRFRSVCKSWYSLVSCPNFISYHSSKTLNKKRLLLQLYDDTKRSHVMSCSSLDESFMESREQDDFPELHAPGMRIVGSCNGLICLFRCRRDDGFIGGRNFFVWNPTIRKVVELPSRYESPSYFGFGFDSKTGDYKVLCFREIKMPDSTIETVMVATPRGVGGYICTRSVEFGGFIHVIAWNTTRNCSVWVMKEYSVAESWTKVYNIDLPSTLVLPRRTLLWGNDEILMAKEMENLFLYNTERRKFECVSPVTKYTRDMCIYEESLVLM